jgi:hypothetical protein
MPKEADEFKSLLLLLLMTTCGCSFASFVRGDFSIVDSERRCRCCTNTGAGILSLSPPLIMVMRLCLGYVSILAMLIDVRLLLCCVNSDIEVVPYCCSDSDSR